MYDKFPDAQVTTAFIILDIDRDGVGPHISCIFRRHATCECSRWRDQLLAKTRANILNIFLNRINWVQRSPTIVKYGS